MDPGLNAFKDHFSDVATAYAAHRPIYPPSLADFLAGLAPRRTLAWDAGCGSGQLSALLAERFEQVMATDASASQIAQARPHPRITYRCAAAEASGLADAAVDLAVAAQAAHWFDLPRYYAEVRRVGRVGAAVALVTYGLIRIAADVDPVLDRFYWNVLGEYWPPERRWVEDQYRSLPFPFVEIPTPALTMRADWALAHTLGYVETWSAVWALVKRQGRGPLEAFRRELARAWGPAETVRPVHWELSLRAGRV